MDKAGNLYSCGQINLPKDAINGKVGAGDAFCAGVLAAAHRGESLEYAMILGNAAATQSLNEPGATEAMKTVEEVMAMAKEFGIAPLPEVE